MKYRWYFKHDTHKGEIKVGDRSKHTTIRFSALASGFGETKCGTIQFMEHQDNGTPYVAIQITPEEFARIKIYVKDENIDGKGEKKVYDFEDYT